jgi:hypothetical protein
MKLTDAQFGALQGIIDHGPAMGEEIVGPPAMDGTRRTKLSCHRISRGTLERLAADGLVIVTRVPEARPVNAVGKPGNRRNSVMVHITDAGRAALASAH